MSRQHPTTVLSYGLGVDSTAILLRWLEEPSSRDFKLDDLVVITAMTGHEFEETGALVTEHILPKLARTNVRFVQLARGGLLQAGGVTVLGDSRHPTTLCLDGDYTLLEELEQGRTVPQYASGRRRCSQKYKGWVIDTWLQRELGDTTTFAHAMGYAMGEEKRADKDRRFATEQRHPFYPLLEWGWDRQACLDYIEQITGVKGWPKSCCFFCPFSGGRTAHIERLATKPTLAVEALVLEYMSLAFNPRQQLFATGTSLEQTLLDAGHKHLIDARDEQLGALDWQLYEVKRLWRSKASCMRSIRVLSDTGSKAWALEQLDQAELAQPELESGQRMQEHPRHRRVWSRKEDHETYPKLEAFLLAAPARYGTDKPRLGEKARGSFDAHWLAALEGSTEMSGRHERLAAGEQLLPGLG
jgi:hypothetical protein